MMLETLKAAALAVHVPFELLRAICTVESNLDPLAVNEYDGNSASYGLCQLKYLTAKSVGYKRPLKDLFKPKINAFYAAKYLKHQLDRYHGDWIRATSAYNRGTASHTNMSYVRKVFKQLIKETRYVRFRYQDQKYTYSLGRAN